MMHGLGLHTYVTCDVLDSPTLGVLCVFCLWCGRAWSGWCYWAYNTCVHHVLDKLGRVVQTTFCMQGIPSRGCFEVGFVLCSLPSRGCFEVGFVLWWSCLYICQTSWLGVIQGPLLVGISLQGIAYMHGLCPLVFSSGDYCRAFEMTVHTTNLLCVGGW